MSEPDEESTSLVRVESGWSGDEHRLRIAAAKEAGLDTVDLEVEMYTEGFKSGMTLDDADDRSIVFRGRTVLKDKQLLKSLTPMLRFLKIPRDQLALRVHDGRFELRVGRETAETAPVALDAAKVALTTWIGSGLIGWLAMQWMPAAAAIVWGLGLFTGGWLIRNGLVSGRARLAGRVTLGLAMLAQEEQLILPPKEAPGTGESG